jgi:hypothetical protein
MNEMSVSPSVWMLPVDISVEWPKTEIWGLDNRFYAVLLFLLM